MAEMFFFEKEPAWRRYMSELGIQKVIDHLKASGHPHEWPLYTVDLGEKYVVFLPFGKGFSCYKSACPRYEGFYLHGGCGSVKCSHCQDLLPGVVLDETCRKNYTACPFYDNKEENNE